MSTAEIVRPSPTASQRLRTTTAATRVSFTWFGAKKALSAEQKAEAAESFGAEGGFISAGKKLIDAKHPAVRGVTAVRGKIQQYWRSLTLPFPEPGIRLIRHDKIDAFDAQMKEFRDELQVAVDVLDESFVELKRHAADRLGRLYNADDYPDSLRSHLAVEWEFPSVEAPSYLMELRPDLYERERQRIAARFDEAVTLAEQTFAAEFSKILAHLTERLTGDDDGKPKVFRDSAVANLQSFFERFQSLNVRSNPELDELVEQAQRLAAGLAPQDLRDNASLRTHIAEQLAVVQTGIDELLIDRPRRKLLRRTEAGGWS